MKKKPVRQTEPLTDEQKAEIEMLVALPDEAIDYSDAPPLPDELWEKAKRGLFYRPTRPTRPTKSSKTIRIDSDVLAWLRSHGKGYQTRINSILRREMLNSLKSDRREPSSSS